MNQSGTSINVTDIERIDLGSYYIGPYMKSRINPVSRRFQGWFWYHHKRSYKIKFQPTHVTKGCRITKTDLGII